MVVPNNLSQSAAVRFTPVSWLSLARNATHARRRAFRSMLAGGGGTCGGGRVFHSPCTRVT